jgi:hypothetical protein
MLYATIHGLVMWHCSALLAAPLNRALEPRSSVLRLCGARGLLREGASRYIARVEWLIDILYAATQYVDSRNVLGWDFDPKAWIRKGRCNCARHA